MKRTSAIFLGKAVYKSVRFLGVGGGSAAPGLISLKIHPNLVADLISKIPKNVVITGTNGKTTTARILAHFAKSRGLKIVRNHTGSNLERGLASALISAAKLVRLEGRLSWQLPFDLGIWELDEAAFNSMALKIKPDIVVFLNVFRDQLDRYGEVDIVVKNWSETLKKVSSKTIILVNGDDINTSRLAKSFKGKTYQFGVKGYKIKGESIEHLKELENLDFEAKNVRLKGLKGSSFELILNHKSFIINLPVPGVYHIYDFLAAFAIGHELGLETKKMLSSLKTFSPAFGRVEKLDFGYIFLTKNPAGATQVFETIAPQIKPQDRLLLALNDNIADGTDVSWIWDANFEMLQGAGYSGQVRVSGTRAYDLAVRLKYAGFNPKQIIVEPNLKQALQQARKGLKGQLFILPTYTAMLELQQVLASSGVKKNYWEEEN